MNIIFSKLYSFLDILSGRERAIKLAISDDVDEREIAKAIQSFTANPSPNIRTIGSIMQRQPRHTQIICMTIINLLSQSRL